MSMKYFFIPICLILFVVWGCSDPSKPKSNEFVVKGKLKNTKGEIILLEELLVNKTQTIDSAKFNEDGEFYFKHTISEPGFYLLKIKNRNFVTLLIKQEETLFVNGDALQLEKTYTVSGSDESSNIRNMYVYYYHNASKVDSLRKVFQDNQDKPEFAAMQDRLDSTYKIIFMDQQKFIKHFIDENCNSMISILALYQSFGQKRLISPEIELTYTEKIDKQLFSKYPKNQHVLNLHERMEKLHREETEKKLIEQHLQVGQMAPNFTLPNLKGDTVSISSLRGKVVLLDFWSPTCEECVKETMNLKWLYKKFQKKEFEIYSIAIESSEKRWKKAISDLYLNWIQVNDFNDMAGPVITLYNVKKIPYTYLIDKDGKILAKGLTFEELTNQLYILLGADKNENVKDQDSSIHTKKSKK